MTITQLLQMPIGQKTGGFLLTVKTAKKFWEVPNAEGQLVGHKGERRTMHQQAILTDDTGEMIADIKILSPEHGNLCHTIKVGAIIRIIVCEIQTAYDKRGDTPEPNKKLFIDQFSAYVKDMPRNAEGQLYGDEGGSQIDEEVIPSMCRNSQVREFIGGFASKTGNVPECNDENKARLTEWVEFVLTGK